MRNSTIHITYFVCAPASLHVLLCKMGLVHATSGESAVATYSRMGCHNWPADSVWQEELGSQLTPKSTLHGPFQWSSLYARECMLGESGSNFDVLAGGKGLCMSNHYCANENCDELGRNNIPAYSIEVHNVLDIQLGLEFARRHNIAVSVKSTGHSLQSQS